MGGEGNLVILVPVLFPISPFDSFTPWGEGRLGEGLQRVALLSDFPPGQSWLPLIRCPSNPSSRPELIFIAGHERGSRINPGSQKSLMH